MSFKDTYDELVYGHVRQLSEFEAQAKEERKRINKESKRWVKDDTSAERVVKDYLKRLKPKEFYNYVKLKLVDYDPLKYTLNKGDFDKYVYLIDTVNAKRILPPIIKKHPNVCNSALLSIVEEYKRLVGSCYRRRHNIDVEICHLVDEADARIREEKIKKNVEFYKSLSTLSKEISDSIIDEIRSSVMDEDNVASK